MIIDCHGHYTTTPPPVEAYRNAQKEILKTNPNHIFEKGTMAVSDDEIRDSIANNQLKENVEQISPSSRREQAGWDIMLAMPAHHKHGQNIKMI